MIQKVKGEAKRVLLLDTGNLLFRRPPQTETRRKEALLRVDLLIRSYNEMGYDAVNVGDKDLLLGLRFLSDLGKKAKFPFLSANLADKRSGRLAFNPSTIKEIGGLKIGILGLMDDEILSGLQEREPEPHVLNPFLTAKDLVKSLRESCDLIIVLSQLGESKDRRLAREIPEIDLILGGGGEMRRVVAERVKEVPIFRLEPRGGYLGRIDYTLADTRRPIRFEPSDERDETEKRLEMLRSRVAHLTSELGSPTKQDEMKRKELKFLESKQKELERNLLTLKSRNSYKHTALPIPSSVKDDPRIMKAMETYRTESARLYQPKGLMSPERDLSEKEMMARIPKGSLFTGAVSCSRCHEVNYRNWLKTKHAKASQTIASSPKASQDECLPCHSTGYGKMGEYMTVDEIPFYLRGVQCESCHGEGRGHPKKGEIQRKVTLGVCRNCHTRDQSPAFNFRAYRERVGCKITE